MEERADLIEILRRLDNPDGLEWPPGYSKSDVEAQFDRLVSRLDADFSACCETDRNIQDSAQYGRIDIPAEATVCGTRIVVLVSKFSPLSMVAADNPGAFLDTREAHAEGDLDLGDLAKAEQALTDMGYLVIPEELLECHYEGTVKLIHHGSDTSTWWHRFFGSF